MKNKEVLVTLPETEMYMAITLYTDGTYEMFDSHGLVIITNTWRRYSGKIYLSHGWGKKAINPEETCLSYERPDLDDLIAWEQIEREILS